MAEKKAPANSVSAPGGKGKRVSAVSGQAYHQAKQPDNDGIWDVCREEIDAKEKARAQREAQHAARLEAAAASLGGFIKDNRGQWRSKCPHCGQTALLISGANVVLAEENDISCPAFAILRERLVAFNHRSEGGAS